MSMLILLSFSLTMTFMLPLMTQPLSLGLIIMLSTLLMCLLAGLFFSSWYAYILFLIYVGGLLVMFIYVATLMPNMLFMNNGYLTFFFVSQILLMWGFSSYISKSLKMTNYNDFTSSSMSKLYGLELISPSLISVFIGLSIVLLLNLIVVVKICYYYYGSLRTYN
uniref:NADH dehydrogenase subunit 6 n=2 Tax=Pomacea TaxID=72702 RepID=A0A0U2DC43_9CAEN|nr:NADH dehydrogenase subunit 6 [Pomacea maculata]AKN78482.1 NADH dehydrogenase subunit 6 [Pomacea occulta]ART65958.1 NADH dehydrogenase subunit 6 [Pomacea maculata]